ncbi:hypothetical protein EGW08_010288, partial [Elysia chlorotica]
RSLVDGPVVFLVPQRHRPQFLQLEDEDAATVMLRLAKVRHYPPVENINLCFPKVSPVPLEEFGKEDLVKLIPHLDFLGTEVACRGVECRIDVLNSVDPDGRAGLDS